MYFEKIKLKKGSRICIIEKTSSGHKETDAEVIKIDGFNFNAQAEDGKTYNDLDCNSAYLFGNCWYYNINKH